MDSVVKALMVAVTVGTASGVAMGSSILPESDFTRRQAARVASYVAVVPSVPDAPAYDPIRARMSADYAKVVSDCDGCSDFQLGYRYAERQGVSQTSDCNEYVWSYERGCLAYLRERRSGT